MIWNSNTDLIKTGSYKTLYFKNGFSLQVNSSYGPGFNLPFGALILLQMVAKPLSQHRGDGQELSQHRANLPGGREQVAGQRPAGCCACAPAEPAGGEGVAVRTAAPAAASDIAVWGTLSSQPDPNSFQGLVLTS